MCQSIGKKKKKVKKRIDPYRAAQAQQRKAANQARQVILKAERREEMGGPVRSKSTPFIESLRPELPADKAMSHTRLNFFLNRKELGKSLKYSGHLTEPLPPDGASTLDYDATKREHADAHQNARRALAAITDLSNGSSKDRTRVNIQRCIDEFGRHNTDQALPPKPASRDNLATVTTKQGTKGMPLRAGPDTGSSEVQAAILTTKIATLADNLHKKDKHNKRNLRVLVHKRQKLLSYLRRQERAGPRWQHLVEQLGINDAMWKGEISL